jgi:multidrug transporter EmrE-like cation transporter
LLILRVVESLVELILVTAAAIMATALVPRSSRARFVLSVCGLAFGAIGVALFMLGTYPKEILLGVGAYAVIEGIAGRYTRVTSWLARRSTRWSVSVPFQRSLSRALARSRNRQTKTVHD